MSASYFPQPNPPPLPARGPPPPVPHHSRPVPALPPRPPPGSYVGGGLSYPNPPDSSYAVPPPPLVHPPAQSHWHANVPGDQHTSSANPWQAPPSYFSPLPPPVANVPPLPPRWTPASPQVPPSIAYQDNIPPQSNPRSLNEPALGAMIKPQLSSNSVLPKFCPKSEYFLFPGAKWYFIASVSPNYVICGKCYHENISNSRFSSHFSVMPAPADPNIMYSCDFSVSRSKRLWAQAVASGDIGPFKQYMAERGAAIPCAGKQGVKGSAPNAPKKWYTPSLGNTIDSFIICETCYEEEIGGSPLERLFTEYKTIKGHGAEDVWTCGLAQAIVRTGVKEAANGQSTWESISQAFNIRRTVPDCPGAKEVKPSTVAWWRPKKEVKGMVICSACYMDWVIPCTTTPGFGAGDFERVPDEIVLESEKSNSKWSCDMALTSIIVPTCQEYNPPLVSQYGEYERLWKTAVESQIANACANQPQNQISPNVKSYALKSSSGTLDSRPIPLDICEPCYMSYVRVLGLERFFVESDYRSSGAVLICDLTWKSLKFPKLLTKLVEAHAMNDFTIFETFAKERVHLPPCPRDNPEPNQNWYGIGSDFLVCPECYLDMVKLSPLSHLITIDNIREPSPIHCMLYSTRTRTLWAEACSSGSVDFFLEFQKNRSAVHTQVAPRIKELHGTWQARLNQQETYLRYYKQMSEASMTSSIVSSMAQTTANSFSHGYYHYQSAPAHAAQLSAASSAKQADEWMAKATNIVIKTDEEIAEEKRLIAIWSEVE